MTIAIGMLCGGGAIIAADTQCTLSEEMSTKRSRKVRKYNGDGFSFAIAETSEDADAATTLVEMISRRLAKCSLQGFDDAESLIVGPMTEWYDAFREAPATQLIVAITIKGIGVQLYLCQPPITLISQTGGYIARGWGAAITDPLAELLCDSFPGRLHPQVALRYLAYLMYRAKTPHGGNVLCGGETDAAYLSVRSGMAVWVDKFMMRDAEQASFQLDFVLKAATEALMGSVGNEQLTHNANAVSSLILRCEKIRATVFHNDAGNLIEM
jgi:hypothetical protein